MSEQTGRELDGANVLLLEDEFLIAMDAEQILKDLGAAKVEIAGTLADAERLAEGGRFDLAMLDVNINGQVSFPLAENLWRRGVAVVFATGYEMKSHGFPEFAVCVTKPYTGANLRKVFSMALGRRAVQHRAG
jgi:CheY-like chemotaxis protein